MEKSGEMYWVTLHGRPWSMGARLRDDSAHCFHRTLKDTSAPSPLLPPPVALLPSSRPEMQSNHPGVAICGLAPGPADRPDP